MESTVREVARREDVAETTVREPWWARYAGFGAVVAAATTGVVVTGSPYPVGGVVVAYVALLRYAPPRP